MAVENWDENILENILYKKGHHNDALLYPKRI